MSTDTLERIRSQIKMLSEPERAKLAHELIKSLDAPFDENVGAAWDSEIMRRISKIETGQASLLTRDEFRKKIKAKIGIQ